jgi:hypothetical protein
MTIYELLTQLLAEIRVEINANTIGDAVLSAKIAGKQELLERAIRLWEQDGVETIDTGDNEHSIVELVPTKETPVENGEPF